MRASPAGRLLQTERAGRKRLFAGRVKKFRENPETLKVQSRCTGVEDRHSEMKNLRPIELKEMQRLRWRIWCLY